MAARSISRVALLGEDVGVLDGRELAGRLGDVERTIRKLEAVAVSIVAEADRREVFRDDGHVSVRGWVKASLRVADVAVTHRVRTAKLVRDRPGVRRRVGGRPARCRPGP